LTTTIFKAITSVLYSGNRYPPSGTWVARVIQIRGLIKDAAARLSHDSCAVVQAVRETISYSLFKVYR